MPAPNQDTVLTWDELTTQQKAAIVRSYLEEQGSQNIGGGEGSLQLDPAGLSDEQLVQVYSQAPGQIGLVGIDGQSMTNTLQATGSPTYWGMLGMEPPPGTGEAGPYGQAYQNGQPTIHTYDPNRGLTPENFANYTGVAPGVSIDLRKYGPSAELQSATAYQQELADYYRGLDANRWNIDPSALAPVDTYTYDPATADVYTTDVSETFDPTRQQLGYANDVLGYALDTNGTPLGQAAELQYLAATGQAPSAADLSLNRDANALFAQQMSMAARARGSASSGLATMNAQNNAALGYANLIGNADIARANEMTAARAGLAQTGLGIRQGDLAGAGQAASNAQQMYSINNSELQAGQANTTALNQGSQFNTGVRNDANQFNVGQMQSADAANALQLKQTLEGNRDVGRDTERQDAAIAAGYDAANLGQLNVDMDRGIRGEQDYQQSVNDVTTILGNMYNGHANNRTALQGIEMQANAQQNAALIGAIGTGLGAAGSMIGSDERMKNVHGKGEAADFSGVKPMKWSYDAEHEDAPGTEWLEDGEEFESGMAHQFPKDVIEEGPDGMMRVNAQKAMMRAFDALGDAQRRIQKLEKRT
jgi:hypothetical protein